MSEKKYAVKVTVEYYYEVEVESEELAEAEGWNYEDYKHGAEVYSIKTEHLADQCEECENWEDECTCEDEEEKEEEQD